MSKAGPKLPGSRIPSLRQRLHLETDQDITTRSATCAQRRAATTDPIASFGSSSFALLRHLDSKCGFRIRPGQPAKAIYHQIPMPMSCPPQCSVPANSIPNSGFKMRPSPRGPDRHPGFARLVAGLAVPAAGKVVRAIFGGFTVVLPVDRHRRVGIAVVVQCVHRGDRGTVRGPARKSELHLPRRCTGPHKAAIV